MDEPEQKRLKEGAPPPPGDLEACPRCGEPVAVIQCGHTNCPPGVSHYGSHYGSHCGSHYVPYCGSHFECC